MSFAGEFRTVGFEGSRDLRGARWRRCRALASRAAVAADRVLTGCQRGADAAARAGAPGARVFDVREWRRRGLPWVAAYARRSIALVQAVADGPAPCLVCFPGGAAPDGLRPSPAGGVCFAGFGSGTWSAAALAAGLGVPVFVFLPGGVRPPAVWGGWVRVRGGVLRHSWRLPAVSRQADLFD